MTPCLELLSDAKAVSAHTYPNMISKNMKSIHLLQFLFCCNDKDALTKSCLRRKADILQPIRRIQCRNLEVGTKAESTEEHCLLVCSQAHNKTFLIVVATEKKLSSVI